MHRFPLGDSEGQGGCGVPGHDSDCDSDEHLKGAPWEGHEDEVNEDNCDEFGQLSSSCHFIEIVNKTGFCFGAWGLSDYIYDEYGGMMGSSQWYSSD